jgi:hypothetical protein
MRNRKYTQKVKSRIGHRETCEIRERVWQGNRLATFLGHGSCVSNHGFPGWARIGSRTRRLYPCPYPLSVVSKAFGAVWPKHDSLNKSQGNRQEREGLSLYPWGNRLFGLSNCRCLSSPVTESCLQNHGGRAKHANRGRNRSRFVFAYFEYFAVGARLP